MVGCVVVSSLVVGSVVMGSVVWIVSSGGGSGPGAGASVVAARVVRALLRLGAVLVSGHEDRGKDAATGEEHQSREESGEPAASVLFAASRAR